jgi:tRNA G18 (ribose-2'-O)-methylase SpoU
MRIPVCCPSPECGDIFDLPSERMGRNVYCLSCGKRMTARPLEVDRQLAEKPPFLAGSEGAACRRLPLRLIVDNVRSLWNVGSIFRTADACGVDHLALTGITGHPPRAEISKTALGADQTVAWSYYPKAETAFEKMCREGYTGVALEATDRAISLDQFEWPDRVCLVLGNEVAGVAAPLLELCSRHVFIPMRGHKESLNVAVACGIAAFAAASSLEKQVLDSNLTDS